MMAAFIFRQALSDFVRFRRVVVWALVALALGGIAQIFILVTEGGPSRQDLYSLMSSIITFRLVALAAAIFSMAVVAQEIEQKTIVYLLTRPIPRWMLLTMRTLAATTVVILVAWACALSTSVGIFGSQPNPQLPRDLVALAMGAAAYTSLFVVVSLFINRAMIVCLLFAFGWETLIPNMSGQLYMLSINSYLNALSERPAIKGTDDLFQALGGLLGTNTLTTDTAWAVLIAIIAACLGLGALWFTRNEYIPREDAE
ncbi:MAG TPA: ABC transporter permease subunit [Fimbriimonas sp.]